jgi:cytolysin (calcineurin-like family phosphatase)
MTPPLKLSDVAKAVIEANTEWDAKDIDDATAISAALDTLAVNVKESGLPALTDARAHLRALLLRNLSAVQSQTLLVAEMHAKAEMVVMTGNAAGRAAS